MTARDPLVDPAVGDIIEYTSCGIRRSVKVISVSDDLVGFMVRSPMGEVSDLMTFTLWRGGWDSEREHVVAVRAVLP